MKEFVYSRSGVYEMLRASRREVFRILVAEEAQPRGRLQEVLGLAEQRGVRVERVKRAQLDKIHEDHQGVAAEVSEFVYSDLVDMLERSRAQQERPFVLILDTLQNPQNFGTLLRTAEAAGVHGVVIPLAHTVEVTPAVVSASAGASEHMLIARNNLAQAIDALKQDDVWVVGLDQSGEAYAESKQRHLRGGLAVVVGSEGEGMRPLVRSKCDVLLSLPMSGKVESLNAAVAGSIALYLAVLARQATKPLRPDA